MALDISESAVYSWLRHIKGYSVVHNNWKISPLLLDEYIMSDSANAIFDAFNHGWEKYYNHKLFAKGLRQTVLQAECDAIGIKVDLNGNTSIALVEVACHTDGLLYTNKNVTADKVVNKTVVDIIMSMLCFGNPKLEVYFVSPVVKPAVKSEIDSKLKYANTILIDELKLDFEIKTMFNDDFSNLINNPLKELINGKKIKSPEESEYYLRGLMIHNT